MRKKGASVTVSFPIIFSAMSQSVLVEHNLYSDLRYHGFKMKNSGSILISCYVHVQQEKKLTGLATHYLHPVNLDRPETREWHINHMQNPVRKDHKHCLGLFLVQLWSSCGPSTVLFKLKQHDIKCYNYQVNLLSPLFLMYHINTKRS